ncbi:MAG: dienelactone hydrolase family protein [Anaerolineae bacterium]|nr:dienelactone hydrolase family protein [Anaerolineae bacterium]
MSKVNFWVDGHERQGVLAVPEVGKGPGVMLLHAWWGLTDFFQSVCEQIAAQGYVCFAPDLHHGKVAATPDEAMHILETRDFPATQATAESALSFLQTHPAVQGAKVAAVGFSMGASFALLLDSLSPDAFSKVVLFYGGSGADLSQSKSRFQGHFGEADEWEPLEEVRKMYAANAEIYTYPGAAHWFCESDRPDYYDAQAAVLAWKRTFAFLSMPDND